MEIMPDPKTQMTGGPAVAGTVTDDPDTICWWIASYIKTTPAEVTKYISQDADGRNFLQWWIAVPYLKILAEEYFRLKNIEAQFKKAKQAICG